MATGAGSAARAAWARLAGLDALERFQVVVDPRSPLGRPGWIAILVVDGTVTVAVPTEDLRAAVTRSLRAVAPEDATRPEVVRPLLPPTTDVLGPATLSYPAPGYEPADAGGEPVDGPELRAFLAGIPAADLEESGFGDDAMAGVHGSRTPTGELAAVCGHRRWPNGVAHLSVVTAPAHRRQGHGRAAAGGALRAALDAGLLPQWRARVPASQALAADLGLVRLGAQLGLAPA